MREQRSPVRDPGQLASLSRDQAPSDVLVAIVNTRLDFEHVRRERWYRIPFASAPPALLAGQIRTIAFYLPKVFGSEAWQVRWTAPLISTMSAARRVLLPDEPEHRRADELYLRLALGPLAALPHPIPSRRLRRIVFITTTRAKLAAAAEINDLFHGSPLEDTLWTALKQEQIEAEREYYVPGDANKRYALDFAVFGQQRNLDVECDGDTYHLNPKSASYDNRRNNYLTTRGWSVLRFTSAQVIKELPDVLQQIRAGVRSCGGAVQVAPAVKPPEMLWQAALWDPSLASGQSVDPRLRARPTRRRQ